MNRPRVRTHCPVPGHGMLCMLAWERSRSRPTRRKIAGNEFHERSTEKRMSLDYEDNADNGERYVRIGRRRQVSKRSRKGEIVS